MYSPMVMRLHLSDKVTTPLSSDDYAIMNYAAWVLDYLENHLILCAISGEA